MSDDFDPRFDPAFQPGYDGPPVLAVARAGGMEAARGTAPVGSGASDVDTDPDAASPVTNAMTGEPTVDEPGPTNPFVIALGAVAVALVVGGVILLTRLREIAAEETTSSDFNYVTLQALVIGTPIAICLGLATGIGLLFVLASRWRRP
jgi:hypothetical protein